MEIAHLRNLNVDVNIILKTILKKWYMRMCAGFEWLRTGFSSRPGVGNLRLASHMLLFGCEAAAL
jgi:hypothetical protein